MKQNFSFLISALVNIEFLQHKSLFEDSFYECFKTNTDEH